MVPTKVGDIRKCPTRDRDGDLRGHDPVLPLGAWPARGTGGLNEYGLLLMNGLGSRVRRTEAFDRPPFLRSTVRILTICRELPPIGGGAGYVASHLASNLAARGHDVHLITMHFGDLPERESRDGVEIHRVRVGRRDADSSHPLEMARFVLAARRLARRLSRRRPFDVAHAHAVVPDGLVVASLPARTTMVVTAHGSDVPGYNPDRFRLLHRLIRPFWLRAARRPDVLTAPSRHLIGLISDAGADRDVELVPNGIDLDLFSPGEGTRDLLVVARLEARKNVHLLLEALTDVDRATRLHVVGDGPERRRLEDGAARLDRHEVVFHGWLDHGSTAWQQLYEQSRFFVFPSSSENFPINLLEAQLAGLVVIASDIPGNREVLGDRARYVATLDGPSLAAALNEALSAPDAALDAEGAAARQRVADNFSWPTVTSRFEALYDRRDAS